jgi:hypothetical protein
LEAPADSNRDAPRAKIGRELRNIVGKERAERMEKRAVVEEVKETIEDLLIRYKGPFWLTATVMGSPLLNYT